MEHRIIVVDDDTTNIKLAGRILSQNGYRVTGLKSGNAFLNYVAENGCPDLVLLDVKMPDMDGFETLERFHASNTAAKATPVVFLTADENEESQERGLSLGAKAFIKKPFIPDDLLKNVREAINTEFM